MKLYKKTLKKYYFYIKSMSINIFKFNIQNIKIKNSKMNK